MDILEIDLIGVRKSGGDQEDDLGLGQPRPSVLQRQTRTVQVVTTDSPFFVGG